MMNKIFHDKFITPLEQNVFYAIKEIYDDSGYKPFIDCIIAFLIGDDTHYIAYKCYKSIHYGCYKSIKKSDVNLAINSLLKKHSISELISKRGRAYYIVRPEEEFDFDLYKAYICICDIEDNYKEVLLDEVLKLPNKESIYYDSLDKDILEEIKTGVQGKENAFLEAIEENLSMGLLILFRPSKSNHLYIKSNKYYDDLFDSPFYEIAENKTKAIKYKNVELSGLGFSNNPDDIKIDFAGHIFTKIDKDHWCPYSSSIEFNIITRMLFARRFIEIKTQCLTINYVNNKKYNPDIVGLDDEGYIYIIEGKQLCDMVDSRVDKKIAALKEYCKKNGFIFTMCDSELRTVDYLKSLPVDGEIESKFNKLIRKGSLNYLEIEEILKEFRYKYSIDEIKNQIAAICLKQQLVVKGRLTVFKYTTISKCNLNSNS